MNNISSHVLDTALGRPAAGIRLRVERERDGGGGWETLGECVTNAEGRAPALCAAGALRAGTYRVSFDTEAYFRAQGLPVFYPRVEVQFIVRSAEHHHIPLLLSPFGYSTYRGS